jgi:hypothetical protein
MSAIHVAGLWLLLIVGLMSCSARRDYAADGQGQAGHASADSYQNQFGPAAQQQADNATASVGDRPRVQSQARQAAEVLKGLVGLVLQLPNTNPKVVSGLTQDVAQLSSGLDAIADSHSDQEFTAAVFGVCEADSLQACSRLGPLLFGLGTRVRIKPPANVPADQVIAWAQYLESLGETLVRVPRQCHRAQEAIAEAKAQAGGQAGSLKSTGVHSRRRRVASNLMLCMAAGMLAPSPNRFQLSTPARIGYAVQQCQ